MSAGCSSAVAAIRASRVRGAGSREVRRSDDEPARSQVFEKGSVRSRVDRVPVGKHDERKRARRSWRGRAGRRWRERRWVVDGGDDRAARRCRLATPCRCRSRRVDERLLRLPDGERPGDRGRGRRRGRDRRRVFSVAGRPALSAEDRGQSIRRDEAEPALLVSLRVRRGLGLCVATATTGRGKKADGHQHSDGEDSWHAASCHPPPRFHATLQSPGVRHPEAVTTRSPLEFTYESRSTSIRESSRPSLFAMSRMSRPRSNLSTSHSNAR